MAEIVVDVELQEVVVVVEVDVQEHEVGNQVLKVAKSL